MTNRLKNETSPYLQQHAHNPVDWFAWGKETLEKARHENKPILLSIGYAACHWCHVMAHESFDDAETAEIMNTFFINIKVDKEERPDLDKIYQTTHYLLTQRSGGWPLTTFLTPDDLTPFFSGTYFPLQQSQQMPAFKEVLLKIKDIFANRQDDIKKQNASLQQVLWHSSTPTKTTLQPNILLQKTVEAIENNYDNKNGGFGTAPKFPHASVLQFLLQEKSPLALNILFHMAEGGIYDQLGGGFFRYSVDAAWEIPHFEKMLYDNALLLPLYAEGSRVFNEPYFAEIAKETADWVLREMQPSEGGYYTSLNADSENEEGKFYIWDLSEIEALLGREEFQIIKIYYGLEGSPNFENRWHLHVVEALRNSHEKNVLRNAKTKLFSAREQRIRPTRDEKILIGWNALMIKGMLIAGTFLQEERFLNSAKQALNWIIQSCWVNQRLIASSTKLAFLDDYAFLIDALLQTYATFNEKNHLMLAQAMADTLLQHFFDTTSGGFYFTADDHEKLLYRPKTFMDEAMPSGNGIAVQALNKLTKLTGNLHYSEAAQKTLEATGKVLNDYPFEHCSLITAITNETN